MRHGRASLAGAATLQWTTTGGVMLLLCNDERETNPGDWAMDYYLGKIFSVIVST